MTPDERNVLQRFLSDLETARGASKDQEADGMINDAIRSNPDAAYLLVQHAILADQALQAAQQRIDALQSGGGQPSGQQGSFLGGEDGRGQAVSGQLSQGQPMQGQPYPQDGFQQPQPQSPLSQNSGLKGFLRGAGTLAAGVAGGEFLAQGLSNLFSPRDW